MITNNIILECAERNGDNIANKTINGQWKNTFSENIPIEDGDVISMKQCLINTRNATSGNLILEEDTTVSITLGFYDMPQIGGGFTTNATDFNTDNDGEATSLSNPSLYRLNANVNPGTVLDNQPYIALYDSGGGAGSNLNNEFYTKKIDIVFSNGSYTPEAIADRITDALSKNANTLIPPTDTPRCYVLGPELANLTPSTDISTQGYNYWYNFFAPSVGPPPILLSNNYLCGASQTQFEFKNNSFQFTYLHTPLKTQDSSNKYLNISTSSFFVSNSDTRDLPFGIDHIQSLSGAFIQNLQPASFWDRLGFTQEYCQSNVYFTKEILKTFPAGNEIEEFKKRTTRQAISNVDYRATDTMVNSVRKNPVQATRSFIQYNSSNDTEPILSGGSFVPEDIGYYLVESISNFNTGFRDTIEKKSSITAIVSKQYNNNDFITAYEESSVQYIHSGNTVFLSDIQINILNPETREVVEGIGKNNVIFFEIDKAVSKKK
ncbi:MAG: hypothetical protein P1U85_21210 [Verrucomicrobiales bacterium]|nr:hypothetical protein [Verrucomicrobiales bacterium]